MKKKNINFKKLSFTKSEIIPLTEDHNKKIFGATAANTCFQSCLCTQPGPCFSVGTEASICVVC